MVHQQLFQHLISHQRLQPAHLQLYRHLTFSSTIQQFIRHIITQCLQFLFKIAEFYNYQLCPVFIYPTTLWSTNNFSDISSVINAFNAFNLPTNNCTDISHFQALSNNSTDMSSHNAFNFCSNRRISELRTLPTSHISYNIMVHQQLFRHPIPSTSSTCPQHYGRPTTSPASHHSQIYIQLDQHCPTTFPTSRFANTFKLADVSHILQHYDPSMIQQLFQHLIFEQLPESPSACQQARLHSINATTL